METKTYQQPHEGVVGEDRAGDVLMTQQGSELALALTAKLYSASLSNTPNGAELFRQLTSPKVGDRVVVLDAASRWPKLDNADTRFKGVGYLVEHRAEWWTTDEQWELDKIEDGTLVDADRMVESDAWYVQYGENPVDICRWVNCTVLAMPLG